MFVFVGEMIGFVCVCVLYKFVTGYIYMVLYSKRVVQKKNTPCHKSSAQVGRF
jgi:hypothetical protein